jgi:hypothetical protein
VQILQKNAAAFGVGGCLEKVASKVEIPLKKGSCLISVLMYGASPAKREVISEQMKKWFKADVIEPLLSPWGFPIVVVY